MVNGSVSGNDVSFDFGTSDWRHQGTVSGSSMNGTVTVTLQLDDQVVILNGSWAAAQQSSSSVIPRAGDVVRARAGNSVGMRDVDAMEAFTGVVAAFAR